jgi:hypothetical protein
MTVDPPAQVAATLACLRSVADEIVVAVDTRVDPAELGAYREVADKLVRFDFRPPIDRPRAWHYSQCSGEWIFSIDGDEVPSAALVDQLPDLVEARDVQQYALPRRWLFPDAATWLGELPWWPDFQFRLVRNDATLAVRSDVHGGIVPVQPTRYLDAPLYHLDCVLRPVEERLAKAREREESDPGRVAHGGGSLNDVLYLPERHDPADLRPVPDEDLSLIDRALASGQDAPVAVLLPPVEMPVAPAADIDAVAAPVSLPDDAYRVSLELFDRDERMAPGERRPVYLRVTNLGTTWWPWAWEQEPRIRVTYHWKAMDGETLVYEGVRSPLPARLDPGETQIVPVWVEAPADAGRYVLEFDLVHEHVRWFESPLVVEMDVADRDR